MKRKNKLNRKIWKRIVERSDYVTVNFITYIAWATDAFAHGATPNH